MTALTRRPLVLALFVASTACGSGCDKKEPPGAPTPPPVGPTAPPPVIPREAPTAGTAGAPPPPKPGEKVQSLQLTMIMIRYRNERFPDPTVTRTKEQALDFARKLEREIRQGTSIERLAYAHSDDREPGATEPFNRGSYSLDPRDRRTQAGLIAAVQATPVGSLASEPYDAQYAYIVFRRDR